MTPGARTEDQHSAEDRIRVVVVDDNAVVRSGLTALLSTHDRITVVGDAADGPTAIAVVEESHPDVTLLDVQMPGMDGVAVLPHIVGRTRVVMTTFSDDPGVIRAALQAGAVGYLVHGTFEATDIASAVVTVAAGTGVFGAPALTALQPPAVPTPTTHADRSLLSDRQIEIMTLVAQGMTNRDIAQRLFLADKTIKNHVNHIFARLGVTTRAQAVALWHGGRGALDGDDAGVALGPDLGPRARPDVGLRAYGSTRSPSTSHRKDPS